MGLDIVMMVFLSESVGSISFGMNSSAPANKGMVKGVNQDNKI